MQAPQNFASAHHAPAGSASHSIRAAVHGIFQDTDALLAGFRTTFLDNARERHVEAGSYMNNLHRSVHAMLAELREAREDATSGVRAELNDYTADLHANVAEAMQEAQGKLRAVSRQRQRAARQFARMRAADNDALKGNGRQQLEELADDRRHAAQSLHSELDAFSEELHSQVEQTRKQHRQELGFEEPRPVKAAPRRKQASRPQPQPLPQKAAAHKKSAPDKAKARTAAAAPQTSQAKAKRPAKGKPAVKAAASAPSRKRRVH